MVEVTILLSDIRPPNQKFIKIKPLEHIRKESNHRSHEKVALIEENAAIQTELQAAYEKLEDLRKQQNRLIEETEAKIATKKSDWENEKLTYMEQAKKEGYQAGFAHGKKTSMDEYALLLEKANEITKAAKIDYHKTLEKSDDAILDIAIHTAEKILKRTLAQQRELFLPIVTEAIKEVKDQTDITIFLHPVNYTFVSEQKDELVHVLEDEKDISIYIDETMSEGHCLIEHEFGQLDASIDTQLKQVRKSLHELMLENKE